MFRSAAAGSHGPSGSISLSVVVVFKQNQAKCCDRSKLSTCETPQFLFADLNYAHLLGSGALSPPAVH